MTGAEINQEIAKLRTQTADLERALIEPTERLARLLTVEPKRYNESHVRIAQSDKQRIEDRLTLIAQRIAALEAQLPTQADVAAAEQQANAYLEQAQTLREQSDQTQRAFADALDHVEHIARELLTRHSEMRALHAKIATLVCDFGLDVPVPAVRLVAESDARLAHVMGKFIGHAAYGELPEGLLAEVENAKANRPSLARAS
jgi:DNA repair exonuclease SbcCD ATPase subunit